MERGTGSNELPAGRCGPVGMVGLGSLGMPLARNLLRAGFAVVGYRRHPNADLADAGGKLARSIEALVHDCTVVVTCLPSAEALADAVSGPAGLVNFVAPGALVIDVSTLPIEVKKAQRSALGVAGATMLDCAITGNHRYVANWTAGLFASGAPNDFHRAEAILRAMTPHVAYVGEFGAGTTVKLIASLLVPVHTLAAAEALNLAQRAGIDLRVAVDAIKGTQASSGMFETRGARMAAGDYSGPPLADYYDRNVSLTLELARTLGGEYPTLHAMATCYRAAIAQGFGDLDQSAMFAFLAGVKR